MNREDKKWQSYEKYRFEASKNGNMQIWSFNQYSALWDQLTIDRRKGNSRSHESIAEQIKYKSEFEVSRSVGRKRMKTLQGYIDKENEKLRNDNKEELDLKLNLYDVKRMNNREYNSFLEDKLGIKPTDIYNDMIKDLMKNVNPKSKNYKNKLKAAKKIANNYMSHNIYGSP